MPRMTELEKVEQRIRDRATDPMRAAFATRAINAVSNLLDQANPKELLEFTSASSDFEVLVRALLGVAESEAIKSRHPLLAGRLRGLKMREELLVATGDLFPVSKVAEILHISRQAVEKRRKAHQLLAVNIGRRGYLYPAWQFEDSIILEAIPKVLASLRDNSPWTILRFFVNGNFRLGGKTPLEVLRTGDVEQVLRAAAEFGEHGAA